MALTAFAALVSCNGFVYEQEEDCTVYYRVKFRYDMNLKFADAFAHEVVDKNAYIRLITPERERLASESTECRVGTRHEALPRSFLIARCSINLACEI